MKLSSTLKFFAIVVAALALLCIVFPANGVTVGGITLRFPKLHSVLVREKQKTIDEFLVKEEERDLTGIRDSIEECYRVLFESQLRFWLPNNDISYFDEFFKLAEKAKSENNVIRILHYGDSQIESDRVTCRIRERIQEIFGGGGPGLLPLRQPCPTYTFSQSCSGFLAGQSTWGDSTFRRANGNYGPMLRSWRITGSATMSLRPYKGQYATDRVSHFSRLAVIFNNRPGPLTATMKDRNGGATFTQSVTEQGVNMISWTMDSATTMATVSLSGNADIYGVLVDNGPGVAVDNIGMRSTSGHQFKMTNLDQLTEAYRLMGAKVIMMQFGGNSLPCFKTQKAINNYCEQMANQIEHIHAACPEAAIIFIGPSDMSTTIGGRRASYPLLAATVESLSKMANEHNASFWSIYHAMGGDNSMVAWNKSGLAGSDYIHFTMKGANLMGDYFSDAFLKLYELFNIRKQLTKEQFNKIWDEVRSHNKDNNDSNNQPSSNNDDK